MKLDPQAVEMAINEFRNYIDDTNEMTNRAVTESINVYRQAECKPFKDAPRDGSVIEAWDTMTEWWRTIRFCEVGRNQYWGSVERDDLVWVEGKALSNFSHYRIQFNPEEG